MQEDKSRLMPFAMHFGYVLGGFWVLKYLFIIFSTQLPALAFAETFLRVGTPFILFYALVKYKAQLSDRKISYWHGIQFAIMLFLFASILEAAIIIVHTIWIDPEYIARTFDRMITMIQSLGMDEKLVEQLTAQNSLSPFAYTFNAAMSNVLIGLFLALFIVPIARNFQLQKNERSSHNQS